MSSFYGYIYLTTNTISNRKYIGRRKGSFAEKYLGSGIALKDAIKKYGEEAFTVQPIFYAFSDEDLNNAEKTIIAYYNASVNEEFYNIAVGGNCWSSSHTPETKAKISKSRMGMIPWNKGVPNPEASKRMTENNPMKNFEARERMRSSKIGKEPVNKLPFIKKVCVMCGTIFEVSMNKKTLNKLTCSRSCAARFSNKKRYSQI